MTFLIPLQNVAQSFSITLANKNYIVASVWNDSPDAGWYISFTNADSNEMIVDNIPLITGADLLSGLEYLGFEGQFIVYTDGDTTQVPTLQNLGVNSNLYFITDVANG